MGAVPDTSTNSTGGPCRTADRLALLAMAEDQDQLGRAIRDSVPRNNSQALTPAHPLLASSELKLRIEGRSTSYLVALDSRSAIIEPETELIITRNNFYINLVRFKEHSYLRTLRTKLNWGLDQRN